MKKRRHNPKGLLTEYDCPPSLEKLLIIDKILDGVQFDLGEDANLAVIYDHMTIETGSIYKRLEKEGAGAVVGGLL